MSQKNDAGPIYLLSEKILFYLVMLSVISLWWLVNSVFSLGLWSFDFESRIKLWGIVCLYTVVQERCVAVDTISLVARILNRSKAHLQSMLLQSKATVLEDFYQHLVCGISNILAAVVRIL